MRKFLPFFLALIGLGTGVGAGFAVRPAEDDAAPGAQAEQEVTDPQSVGAESLGDPTHSGAKEGASFDYVRLNNQFVVPVLKDGRVAALVVLTLSVEVTSGSTESVYTREPKLRDGLLVVLFDHAAAGGFEGDFTAPTKMGALRRALTEKARSILGPIAHGILIQDIVRQDS